MEREAESENWIGVGIDIGDRKALEAQFRQAQKMEAVGQLAGGVAHDFNNLLTAIIGYASSLLRPLGPTTAPRATSTRSCKAAERAAALTRQLLAFSRKQVLQPTRASISTRSSPDIEQMLRRLIGEDIELVVEHSPPTSRPVRADPGQLEQVMMNLRSTRATRCRRAAR